MKNKNEIFMEVYREICNELNQRFEEKKVVIYDILPLKEANTFEVFYSLIQENTKSVTVKIDNEIEYNQDTDKIKELFDAILFLIREDTELNSAEALDKIDVLITNHIISENQEKRNKGYSEINQIADYLDTIQGHYKSLSDLMFKQANSDNSKDKYGHEHNGKVKFIDLLLLKIDNGDFNGK